MVGAESGDEGDDGEAEEDDSSQQRLAIGPSADAHDVTARLITAGKPRFPPIRRPSRLWQERGRCKLGLRASIDR